MMNKATLKQVFSACEDMVKNGEKPTITALRVIFPFARRNALLDKYEQWKFTKTDEELAVIYDKPLPNYVTPQAAYDGLSEKYKNLLLKIDVINQNCITLERRVKSLEHLLEED